MIPSYESHPCFAQDLFCLEYFCGCASVVKAFSLGPIFGFQLALEKHNGSICGTLWCEILFIYMAWLHYPSPPFDGRPHSGELGLAAHLGQHTADGIDICILRLLKFKCNWGYLGNHVT